MAKVENVANYILSLVEDDCDELMSNMKLQKLLYYCQGFHLALEGKELFEDDIEAWQHGPVVPVMFHKYKKYGSNGISKPINFDSTVITESERMVINQVFEIFGKYSAWGLRNMTHKEIPWKNVYRSNVSNLIISKESLKSYFLTQIEEN